MTAVSKGILPQVGGVTLCAFVAGLSFALASFTGVSATILALLAGLTLQKASDIRQFAEGVGFSSDHILKLGIVLLGARISVSDLLSLGWMPLAIAVVAVLVSIGTGLILAKKRQKPLAFAVLTGSSVGICGAAAAATISCVLPRSTENSVNGIAEKDITCTAVTVTAFSAIAMLIYPTIFGFLGAGNELAGYFIGGTIHGFGQAIGAGYAFSESGGYVATVTKLTRVALLMPVVFLAAITFRRGNSGSIPFMPRFPIFLIGFIVVIAINSLGFLPKDMREILSAGSNIFILMGLAALGMKTSFAALREVGFGTFLFITVQTLVLTLSIATMLLVLV